MPQTLYPNLESLKQRLGIQPVNTGQQFNYRGIVFDDIEALHAVTSISGDCLNLVSGIELSTTEYRGQTQDYETCLSSLDRINHDHELFAALCRSIYFKQALEFHPVITQLKNNVLCLDERVTPLPICINLEGIAQHYGLPTEYLDITSNFSVASFFATQHWNNKTKRFEPVRMLSPPGVIYKFHPPFLMEHTNDNEAIIYQTVGWQPFPRPEEQRANAIRLKPGEDFVKSMPVASFFFEHTRSQSKRIYEEFEGGDKLMPADELVEFADSLQAKTSFPQSTLDQAFQNYAKRRKLQDTAEKRQSLMTKASITLEVEDSLAALNWNFNQQVFDTKMQRMLAKIRMRFTLPKLIE